MRIIRINTGAALLVTVGKAEITAGSLFKIDHQNQSYKQEEKQLAG
jgi:hypothetical protein